jgi:hypothetical protein
MLVELATPLQRAIGWNNMMMRELCRVWWAASRVAAAETEALAAADVGDDRVGDQGDKGGPAHYTVNNSEQSMT